MNNSGAAERIPGFQLGRRLQNYLLNHRRAIFSSLLQWLSAPWSHLMIALVIGITLALPATLQALFANVARVGNGWEEDMAQVSLFLRPGMTDAEALDVAHHIEAMAGIASVRYISPKQALEEFQRTAGVTDALAYLEENPLPAVLVVRPASGQAGLPILRVLLQRLKALPKVEGAQLDVDWLARLYALSDVVQRGIWLLAGLLSLAVLLTVGNTIRLGVESRRDEIVITKLLGASDSFVRRPFIYSGIWYGLAGGLLALAVVDGLLWALDEPVTHLASLYHSEFRLEMLDSVPAAVLLVGGATLGWMGAWLALGRHLRQAEPV